ncbi:MAG: ATP synthase F0 subunit B [Holosporales bacterium]|jgi:F0F1-type ATP synthase membrane subunit b/b'|nr:ATP synthase F0 subunit B [Holosporales bacterium]
MLPQLNSAFYTSQVIWVIVCLAVLIMAFKKSFIPRINAALEKREEFIRRLGSDIQTLETEIMVLKDKIREIQQEEIRQTSAIIRDATKKAEVMLEEQMKNLKAENEDLINGTRRHLREEIKGLGQVFKLQIDITAGILFEKLFGPMAQR